MKLFNLGRLTILKKQQSQLLRQSVYGIYTKDKDLDKSQYKPSEKEELKNYIKNYLHDDPKKMSDVEKAKLEEEANKVESEDKNKMSKQVEEPKQGFLNPKALKEIFDKMTEIDSDPNSKRAQEYYSKLEELERQNPNKKKSQIIIKTMKRGRTIKQEYQNNQFIGQSLTEEEQLIKKKHIDLKAHKFPEVNPLEYKVKQGSNTLAIANYRYPSLTQHRKGIVHFINGYGDYCARYAHIAHQFAAAGYDFVCMDPRGFGFSQGKKAYIESEELLLQDYLRFQDLINDKFGGNDVPKLQLGYSMGGLASIKMSIIRPEFYKGMGLVTPYLQLLNQSILNNSQKTFISILDKFVPSMGLPLPPKERKAAFNNPYLAKINNDPLVITDKIPVHNIVLNEAIVKKFQEKEADKVTLPFIMLLSGKDQVVCNKASKNFFDISSSKVNDKDLVTYDDADHFILLDNEFMPMAVKDLIGWFNTHV